MFQPSYFDLFDRVPAEAIRGARRAFAARFDFERPSFGFGPAGHGRVRGGGEAPECGRGGPGGFGPGGPFGPGGFGPGGPFGPGGFGPFGGPGWGGAPHGRGRGRGRRRSRGHDRRSFDLRAAVLTLLAEEPMHGYELMRRINERSKGLWRPSPGSIYPALAKLREEGFVLIEEVDGRKVARLTEIGRAHVEEFAAELGEVWAEADSGEDDPMVDFWAEAGQLFVAIRQLATISDPDQLEKATAVIAATRRKLYSVLAEEQAGEGPDADLD